MKKKKRYILEMLLVPIYDILYQIKKEFHLLVFPLLFSQFQTVLYIIICRNIFLVGRVVQAHCHANQLQQSSNSDSQRQYSGTKISTLYPTPVTDNHMSAMPMLTPRSQSHILTISNSPQKNG